MSVENSSKENKDKALNISVVRKSLCQHNWMYKTFSWSRIPPFRYCSKCNKLKY